MKIKKIFILILSGIMIILSSCSEDTEHETKSIAEEGLEIKETLKGCNIVSDLEGLPEAKESQEYNYETDYNPSWIVCNGAADANNQIYTNCDVNLIYYYQKSSKKLELLCGKPECDHSTEDCNAYIRSTMGIQYYNGFLYVVSANDQFMLKKINMDGSERENIGSLAVGGSIVETNNSGNSIFWIIHRGYIYYTYSASASTGSEDTYHLNNSNYIFRMSLEGDKEPECIMKLPYISHCSLKGIGSYVYITTWDMDLISGNICRYNTETGNLEWFESLGNNIKECTEKDGLIYYMQTNEENSEFKLMSYSTATKQTNEITSINARAWSIFYDEDFLYLLYGYTYNGPPDMTRFYVMDWNYSIIANVELEESNGYRSWLGTDDNCIYILRQRTDETARGESSYFIEYIEKDDLADGEYSIQECIY